MPVTRLRAPLFFFWMVICVVGIVPGTAAGEDAPKWMHALVGATLPSHDEKAEAVLLYSETNVTVLSQDKVRKQVREAYKILRPEGRERGTVEVGFNPERKIKGLYGWCIPAKGKDYEVTERDAIEGFAAPGFVLFTDTKVKVLRIPAPDPGNIVGYEYEVEERPFFLQDIWRFQETDPVLESHYSLQLPPGWVFRASWLYHPEVKPDEGSDSVLRWAVSDVKRIEPEPHMPPWEGLAGQMIVSFFPAGGTSQKNELVSWKGMGSWYQNLISSQMDASEPIRQEVNVLVAGKTTTVAKMQAIAGFMQHDIRYVEISMGNIGGWRPHAATDVFSRRYGDCKDKATLMHAMLREIGVDSYLVLINMRRGAVTSATPPRKEFQHAILATKLPEDANDPSLIAVIQHPKLGRVLFFDPTNEITPFGQIGGYLQANYGLLVMPEGGDLVELPQQPSAMNSIQFVGKLTLDANGTLKGDVQEVRLGDRAASERWRLRTVTKDADRIKPIEDLLAGSLSNFQIVRATVMNSEHTDRPFGFNYSFESLNYAKNAGNLLLVRPRVLGSNSSSVLETKDPRKFPYEFEGPERDTDSFDIALPPGYEVDELPAPVDADYSFGSYHSKTEASGNVLHYTRSVEIKELSVPLGKMDELKKFYRLIASDERNTAVLKPAGPGK